MSLDFMNTFLEHLKDELAYQGMTQKQLADKTGISVNTIRGWFSKDLSPDVFSAVKIANALNVSAEYLLTGKEKKHELSHEQIKWLNLYNTLSEHEKKLAYAVISAITNCYENEISPDGENYIITT